MKDLLDKDFKIIVLNILKDITEELEKVKKTVCEQKRSFSVEKDCLFSKW